MTLLNNVCIFGQLHVVKEGLGMQSGQKELGLLEYICQELNCNYISDLCQESCLSQIQQVVRYIDHDRYDLDQWKDAVYYITKKKVNKETAGQFIEYLLQL